VRRWYLTEKPSVFDLVVLSISPQGITGEAGNPEANKGSDGPAKPVIPDLSTTGKVRKELALVGV
jgi:hypothetical protein